MKTFKSFLKEDSFKKIDIPKYFRVVIDLTHESVFEDLSKMKLKGVKGISAAGNVAQTYFVSPTDALLIMKGSDVVKNNKLSRVLYTTPEYFISKNFKLLKRVGNYGDNPYLYNSIINQMIKKRVKRMLNNKELRNIFSLSEFMFNNSKNIRYAKDFAVLLKKSIEKLNIKNSIFDVFLNMSDKNLITLIKNAVFSLTSPYNEEREWYIKNGILNVPKKSFLYILNGKYYDEIFEKVKRNIDKYGLWKLYRIKILDDDKWNKSRIKKLGF